MLSEGSALKEVCFKPFMANHIHRSKRFEIGSE